MTYSQPAAQLSITSFNLHPYSDIPMMIWNHNAMFQIILWPACRWYPWNSAFINLNILSGHCYAIYAIVCHLFLSSHRKMSNVIWNAGISTSPLFDAGESMLSYAGIPSKIGTQPYLSYFICCLFWRCETFIDRNWKKKRMENAWKNIRSSEYEYFVKYW